MDIPLASRSSAVFSGLLYLMLRLLVTVLTVWLSDAALSSEEQAIKGHPPAPCAEIQGKGYSALARMLSSSPPKTICGLLETGVLGVAVAGDL